MMSEEVKWDLALWFFFLFVSGRTEMEQGEQFRVWHIIGWSTGWDKLVRCLHLSPHIFLVVHVQDKGQVTCLLLGQLNTFGKLRSMPFPCSLSQESNIPIWIYCLWIWRFHLYSQSEGFHHVKKNRDIFSEWSWGKVWLEWLTKEEYPYFWGTRCHCCTVGGRCRA